MTSLVYSDSSDWHSHVVGRAEIRNTALHARSALAMARVVESFDPELAVEYRCEAENTAFQVGFNVIVRRVPLQPASRVRRQRDV